MMRPIILMVSFLCFFLAPTCGQDCFMENGFVYALQKNPGTMTLTGYEHSLLSDGGHALRIPSEVSHENKRYRVLRIEDRALANLSDVESIVVEDGVETIGNYAFEHCINLKSINLPASLMGIGEGVFGSCYSLRTIVVDPLNENFDSREGSNAILAGDELLAACPNTKIPSSVKSIGANAFFHCNTLEELVIPEGVEKIGYGAFFGCSSLKRVSLPESLRKIYPEVFCGCNSLDSIYIPKNVKEILGNNIFLGCNRLRSITVDKNNAVFDSRDNCNAIVRKKDSTLIESCVTTTIVEGIKRLGDGCFYGVNLHTIRIPKSVEHLSGKSFSGCYEIDSFFVDPANAFFMSPKGTNAILTKDGKTLVAGCRTTEIPVCVEIIGESAFEGRYSKLMLNLPKGLKAIDAFAFNGCDAISEVIIPSSVESLSPYMFLNCRHLKVLQLLAPVEKIPLAAFSGCTSLSVVSLPEGIKEIDSKAFDGCPYKIR